MAFGSLFAGFLLGVLLVSWLVRGKLNDLAEEAEMRKAWVEEVAKKDVQCLGGSRTF